MSKDIAINSICFIEPGKSYLPELEAYTQFLSNFDIKVSRHTSVEQVPDDAGVIWIICGKAPTIPKRFKNTPIVVHEYASASVGRFAFLKDKLKRLLHPKPTYRIFLNKWVERQFNFKDKVPSFYRDMGVPDYFFNTEHSEKTYDFIYVGETSRLLAFHAELSALNQAGKSLAIIGSFDKSVEDLVSTLPHVELLGRKKQSEIPYFLSRAKTGLNLMPTERPYVYQTATKVYEYLAAGLPILSNSYQWIDDLASKHNETIVVKKQLDIKESWLQVDSALINFHPAKNGLEVYSWHAQLNSFGLFQALKLVP
ncbi:glycosyltransferase [Glaciecola sp. MH2013]|uniref:glycosyltransferase n=1 Tax=Glaciecola sp. MH2013 TaxID=2785524 RepID=UPI0018A0A30D|nr:glycosyltransferase [Glaciecola sp. MH2013]MBF7072244.1 glycosyltransferase [Glaciecola sp. MH2013]